MLAQQARKVDQQDLYRYWILLNQQVQMDVPNSGLNLDKPGCVAVTLHHRLRRRAARREGGQGGAESDLGPVARSAVNRFPLRPVAEQPASGQPVATYYIVPFNAPEDKARSASS